MFPPERLCYLGLALVGWLLALWAKHSLPPGTDMMPVPITTRSVVGPYRWLEHPMYVGNTLFVAGLIAAGGVFALLGAAELAGFLFRYWAYRETAPRTGAPTVR